MQSNLYRLTCSIDSVLAAESEDEAIAFARAQHHEIQVEQLDGPEALVGLDPDEIVLALAALQRVYHLNGELGRDGPAVQALIGRLEEAITLIDHQASLHRDVVSGP